MTAEPTATVQAAVIDAFGGPEQLHVAAVTLSLPGEGEVQIRMAGSAINPVDLGTRDEGLITTHAARFPTTLGWDIAGTIEHAGVTAWEVGDRVAAMVPQPADQNGTYAEMWSRRGGAHRSRSGRGEPVERGDGAARGPDRQPVEAHRGLEARASFRGGR